MLPDMTVVGKRAACIAVAGALATSACSVPVGSADAAAPGTHAVYAVSRTTELGAGGVRTESTEAVARFLVAAEPDSRALELVGAALSLPEPGACLQFGRARLPVLSGPVDLADPGIVLLRVGDREGPMTRRHLPDVADLVRGSVFTANTVDLPPGEHYEFRSAAGAVQGTAPEELTHLRINDEDFVDGMTLLTGGTGAQAGRLDLSWSPPRGPSGSSLVYIDVSSRDALTPTTRCTFEDRGVASLPVVALDGMRDGLLAVHRVRRESQVQPSSELRFDFAVRASFHTSGR